MKSNFVIVTKTSFWDDELLESYYVVDLHDLVLRYNILDLNDGIVESVTGSDILSLENIVIGNLEGNCVMSFAEEEVIEMLGGRVVIQNRGFKGFYIIIDGVCHNFWYTKTGILIYNNKKALTTSGIELYMLYAEVIGSYFILYTMSGLYSGKKVAFIFNLSKNELVHIHSCVYRYVSHIYDKGMAGKIGMLLK